MNRLRKTIAGIAPTQYQWLVLMPYFAPLAVCPITSSAPRLADMKAMPVTQWEKLRLESRKCPTFRALNTQPAARHSPRAVPTMRRVLFEKASQTMVLATGLAREAA